MPQNPLLPNARLRQLYSLMQRARALAARGSLRLEAVLAATVLHLEAGDHFSPPPDDRIALKLLSERLVGSAPKNRSTRSSTAAHPPGLSRQRLAVAAGIARGFQLSGDQRLVTAVLRVGEREEGWADVLSYANAATIPLLVVCLDDDRGRPSKNPDKLTWQNLSHVARRLRLPVLSVDGADAVAVYRVMQESVIRARMGGGPAVLWCVLPRAGQDAPTADPLRHMRRYLAVRNLLPRPSSIRAK